MGRERRALLAACLTAGVMLVAVLGAVVNVAVAATPPALTEQAQADALRRAHAAVVGVQSLAVAEAHSNSALGRVRQGSGVVIGHDGLVLTIGYLILEADQVQLVVDDERHVPARVVAYDVATGFGLLQALTPLRVEPAPMGSAQALAADEPLLMASGGETAVMALTQLVSRRSFAGYWEYLIDGALFTAPAQPWHSGAGLFNARGELVGIGSLVVAHALGDSEAPLPGNMFVPIDLLPPILAELQRNGLSAASRRAWLGVNCVENAGQVRVVRVSAESPAALAGLQPGDRIERIDGTVVGSLAALWQALWRGGQPEREVTLDIVRGDAPQTVKLQTVDRMKTLRRAQGI
ncbi:S1C family serine protease [Aquincola sp. MAHUQ-54]|uniref:S1C family serine protease n=1 Tax=Aquincola agrisoli TaxID=3119538 RepID=A0AAW9Q0R4_9BURK